MRRAAKVDANQNAIVSALRKAGCAVQQLQQGGGVPDLLVARKDMPNTLMEVKDGTKPPSARKLNLLQQFWVKNWPQPVYVVYSAEEALRVVEVLRADERRA